MFIKQLRNRKSTLGIIISLTFGLIVFLLFSLAYTHAAFSEGDGTAGAGQPTSGGTTGGYFSEGDGINGTGQPTGAGSAQTTSGNATDPCAGLSGPSLSDCQSYGSGPSGGGSFSEGDGINGTGQPTSGGAGGSSVGGSGSSVGGSGSSVTNTGVVKIINPLKFATLEAFLLAIIDVLLTFALPVIIFFIMYAGYLFVTAAGNEGKVSAAKNALLYAVIGGVVILGAKLIISVIQGTIRAFGS